MILVDTTVWVDFFSGRETKQVQYLVQYIEQREELCICGIILTEILQGIRSQKEYAQVENLFSTLLYLEMDKDTFILAAPGLSAITNTRMQIYFKAARSLLMSKCIHHKLLA